MRVPQGQGGVGRHGMQRGAAALPIGVLLLFIAALVLIAVSRTTLMEQRISGNEIRARQAMQAAQAGISHAMAYVQAGGIDQDNAPGRADAITPLTLPNGASYQVYFCDPSPPAMPETYPPLDACENPSSLATCGSGFTTQSRFGSPLVLACGRSDDGVALQPVVVSFSRAITLAASPRAPVISKGTFNVQGSVMVANYFNNLTIWMGGPMEGIGHSGTTFIRHPDIPQPKMTDPPPSTIPNSCKANASYICMSDKTTQGPDIIDKDLRLKNLSNADMFAHYFGHDFETYRDHIATRSIPLSQVSSLAGLGGEAVVITGANAGLSLPAGAIGSQDHPVLLIIEGNWDQRGDTSVYGLIYIKGNAEITGQVSVHGNVTVEGGVAGTGSLEVIFDPFANEDGSNKLQHLGKPGMWSGSWRDWL